jgi:hypothetical protein
MASVFNDASRSVLDIVRESLDVNADGDVSFRSRTGRGSGKAVEIPASQFDEFVKLMVSTRDSREDLVQKQKENPTSTTSETEE